MNPWKILGVNRQTSLEDIHNAYIELARKYHPDRGGDNQKFSIITGAWSLIKNKRELVKFINQLETIGKLCAACKGTGAKFKQKSITQRIASTCKACEGSGIIIKEKKK